MSIHSYYSTIKIQYIFLHITSINVQVFRFYRCIKVNNLRTTNLIYKIKVSWMYTITHWFLNIVYFDPSSNKNQVELVGKF